VGNRDLQRFDAEMEKSVFVSPGPSGEAFALCYESAMGLTTKEDT
jgi:serine protease inhibitor